MVSILTLFLPGLVFGSTGGHTQSLNSFLHAFVVFPLIRNRPLDIAALMFGPLQRLQQKTIFSSILASFDSHTHGNPGGLLASFREEVCGLLEAKRLNRLFQLFVLVQRSHILIHMGDACAVGTHAPPVSRRRKTLHRAKNKARGPGFIEPWSTIFC